MNEHYNVKDAGMWFNFIEIKKILTNGEYFSRRAHEDIAGQGFDRHAIITIDKGTHKIATSWCISYDLRTAIGPISI